MPPFLTAIPKNLFLRCQENNELACLLRGPIRVFQTLVPLFDHCRLCKCMKNENNASKLHPDICDKLFLFHG